jgi:hypothetical protein
MEDKPKFIHGEPPSGYSLITFDDKPMKPMLWYTNAVKVARATGKPLKEYIITLDRGMYTLWVKKSKGSGKMVGTGFKEMKSLVRKKK